MAFNISRMSLPIAEQLPEMFERLQAIPMHEIMRMSNGAIKL